MIYQKIKLQKLFHIIVAIVIPRVHKQLEQFEEQVRNKTSQVPHISIHGTPHSVENSYLPCVLRELDSPQVCTVQVLSCIPLIFTCMEQSPLLCVTKNYAFGKSHFLCDIKPSIVVQCPWLGINVWANFYCT